VGAPHKLHSKVEKYEGWGKGISNRNGEMVGYGDTGGASRFFYCAKVSQNERNAGIPDGEKNDHPTVKPIALMEYLCKLVTPSKGLILDPFMGSGSTIVAACKSGFNYYGIDQDEHYVEISKYRIENIISQTKLDKVLT
jgi:site-specific DNA-methyltransferase (adenine-specific)